MLTNNRFLAVCAVLIGSVSADQAHADSTATVRKALQALYDQSSAAVSRKDIVAATAIDTLDYVFIDDKGQKHTLAENRARAAQLFKRPQIIKATAHVDKVNLQGKNVVADVTQHLYMKYTGPKTHYVIVTDQWSTTRDLWVKQGAAWQRSRSQSRSVRVTVNGKQVYKTTVH